MNADKVKLKNGIASIHLVKSIFDSGRCSAHITETISSGFIICVYPRPSAVK